LYGPLWWPSTHRTLSLFIPPSRTSLASQWHVMKFLKIKNRTPTPLHFVFTTISSCRCSVCMEWVRCETSPIGYWPGQAFGSLTYNEGKDYTFVGGQAEMCFTHQLPTVTSPDCKVGTGLRLAMVAGRLALICAGAPDVGIIGDIISFFS
jgi:hypothetical protein